MIPDDRSPSRLARSAKRAAGALAVGAPTVAALAMGIMFVMPGVFASGTTDPASAVWATVTRPVPAHPTVPAPETTPAKRTTAAPSANPTVAPPVTPAKPGPAAKTTPAKTTPAKATPAKTTPARAPTGPLLVAVNAAGGQAQIDACNGPILWEGNVIAQHNTCGGTQFYILKVGSLVTLTGTAVTPGTYKVVSIVDIAVGKVYLTPHPYAIQTCISLGQARMWYLQPV